MTDAKDTTSRKLGCHMQQSSGSLPGSPTNMQPRQLARRCRPRVSLNLGNYVKMAPLSFVTVVAVLFAAACADDGKRVLYGLGVHEDLGAAGQLPCADLLALYRSTPATPTTAPPDTLSEDLEHQFTLNGSVPLEDFFVDDTLDGKGTHYQYGPKDLAPHLASAKKIMQGQQAVHRPTDRWIVDALRAHESSIRGTHALVFGSNSPFYEALLLAAGAETVTVVEYNKLTYHHDAIINVQPFELQVPEGGFDVVLSISSFDHDGLGRYGDPLDPVADVRAVALARCLTRPKSGKLFLTVPIGPDVVVYNLHRRYGRKRLGGLLRLGMHPGWDVIEVHGWDEQRFNAEANFRQTYEPVFVLSPRSAARDEL
eukprot:m.105338 g.105338  ORF g.105338 m.105338 type:complete len:369 (+) comp15706_c0_seq1:183-1289(+)